jgi:sec-independent protein translocase protein TatA
MGGASIWHWVVVGIIAMLLFGRGKISDMMGDVAKGIKAFKKGMADDDEAVTTPVATPVEPVRSLDHQGPQPVGTTSTLADRKLG